MEQLRVWRKGKQWTQAELAKKLGTDNFQVSRWEHGRHRPNRMAREQLRRLGFVISQ